MTRVTKKVCSPKILEKKLNTVPVQKSHITEKVESGMYVYYWIVFVFFRVNAYIPENTKKILLIIFIEIIDKIYLLFEGKYVLLLSISNFLPHPAFHLYIFLKECVIENKQSILIPSGFFIETWKTLNRNFWKVLKQVIYKNTNKYFFLYKC